ncbi:hypothetical protein DIZ76_011727 [Coccidioides immitis]|nr:hypothetical protein DIZ76_011727 [Coccidioides immitis]
MDDCILCGDYFNDFRRHLDKTWLDEFRAVYCVDEECRISGIGRDHGYLQGTVLVPLDETTRWTDRGVLFIRVSMMRRPCRNVDRARGFIFHDSCWRLLKEVYNQDPIPLRRLLEVCKSVPVDDHNRLLWSHEYGRREYNYQIWDQVPYDPYNVPDVQHILSKPLHLPRFQPSRKAKCARKEHGRKANNPTSTMPDLSNDSHEKNYFKKLPFEILEEIASYLEVADFLRLRSVSKPFCPIFSSRRFWKIRFWNERGFIFEALDSTIKRRLNWQSLYWHTNGPKLSLALSNRKRVWTLNQMLQEKLDLRWIEDPKLCHDDPGDVNWEWREVHGEMIEESFREFSNGCRRFHRRWATLPPNVTKIGVSTIHDGRESYVTGMQVISEGSQPLQIGYMNPISARQVFAEITSLEGFTVAVGPGGIQAVQMIMGNDCQSGWLGRPDEEAAVTRRLAAGEPISALAMGFDGYKMVSLAVGKNTLMPNTRPFSDDLRETALWHRRIPGPNHHLSYESFVGRDPTFGYSPLHVALFGGPGGCYLRSLFGISVSYADHGIMGIDFLHRDGHVPYECWRLGYHTFGLQRGFYIDGRNGELIESVDIDTFHYPDEVVHGISRHGVIYTNRGRSYNFSRWPRFGPGTKKPRAISRVQKVRAAPGAVITGFYAAHVRS